MIEFKPAADFIDDDPWPRPAPVGDGSPFAAVAAARAATATGIVLGPVVHQSPRLRPLRSWRFGQSGTAVSLPDCWSRRDPGLADYRGPAAYEREVDVEGPFARVLFGGIDYIGAVSVDGERRVLHEGGFTPVAVDVPAGRSTVRVDVDDPVEPAMLEPDPLLRPKRKVKGVHEEHDSRPGGMAIGSHFDPAIWGVRWGTGGLTDTAWLHEHGRVRIDAVFVTAEPGSLRVNWVLTSVEAVDVELHARVDGAVDGFVVQAALEPGANRVAVRLAVSGETPWTPDEPRVYRLDSAVLVAGEVSDAHSTEFGFRHVAMESFQLRLNGDRVYVRAANYIPGVWPSELSSQTVERDMALARAAGLNSLGLHAGIARHAPRAADHAGVLLYQDFPLQWSYDPDRGPLADDGPTFAEASLWLAAELVYQFYNHPSIVYWCGHNEPAYQLREAFGTVNVPELLGLVETMDACPNEESLDMRRGDLFAQVDPSRAVNAVSGLGATRGDGDNHDYTGSLSGGTATDAGTGSVPFVSEYGAWSANFSAALDVPGATGDWPPPPEAEVDWYVRTHLFSTQVTYAGRPSRYPDFQTWCFAGQLWAGWHAKVVTEKARLAKWSPSAAHRYHFFVDHWGEAGAGMVDKWRTTGPGYRGLAAANRPLVALAPFPRGTRVRPGEAVRLPIVVVNDHLRDLGPVAVRWRLALLDGPDDCWLVGRDDPERPGPLQGELAPPDQCCVLPRAEGTTLLSGQATVDVGPDAIVQADEVVWTADVEGPVALFMDVAGVVGWTSFMVAPDGWRPAPGLVGRSRFRVAGEGELRRRWTGEVVDKTSAPPDQYLLDGRPVDVYDDVDVDDRGVVTAPTLPWPDPLAVTS